MDPTVLAALGHSQTIDITTIGRRTGEPRRIEIALHNLGGRLVISGMPRPGHVRAWLRNVNSNPKVILHLKGPGATADVEGTAREITDPAERRELIEAVARAWRRTDIEVMMAHSPLMEVTVAGYPGALDGGR
jgi:deazaflavin-dependent oxidoreductase (nitroreductase family)